MLQATGPSTPISRTPQFKPDNIPGSWRHPHLDEVTRRLNKSTFSEKNFRTIILSAIFLVASFSYPGFIGNYIGQTQIFRALLPYLHYLLLLLRLLFVVNIVSAISPLATGKDDLSDIPLSPSQRALFGLNPSSAPATPGSTYITPPRYTRSPTPRSSGRRHSGSQATRKNGSFGASGSPYTPNGSPLRQQALESSVVRRLSVGSYYDFGVSASSSNFNTSRMPGTPTPITKNGINLNSKWLYEKSKGSPNLDI